jgi:hypothetical protein
MCLQLLLLVGCVVVHSLATAAWGGSQQQCCWHLRQGRCLQLQQLLLLLLLVLVLLLLLA